jgi:2-phosphosulfolactate phosphatase
MRTIDVCLSPDLMHLYNVRDKTVVVVDILRATSCMTTAIAHGVNHIVPFEHLDACLRKRDDGYLTAGERDGKKVDGFDLGNSPFEYMDDDMKGAKIAFTTTNGTRAIAGSSGAKEIIIGSFLNLSTVTHYLAQGDNNMLILCAGWKGKVNLEDSLFAGAIVEALQSVAAPECDAPLAAQTLYQAAKPDLLKFLRPSSHVRRLSKLGIEKDIAFCLTQNLYNVLPAMRAGALVNLA